MRRLIFLVRGLMFVGTRYQCPCCDWSLRSFVGKSNLSRTTDGYCPRCNSKARHRRDWMYLEPRLASADGLRILDIAPWWSVGRKLSGMPNVDYCGLDLDPDAPFVDVAGDLADMPVDSDSFDGVICIHVLEHVDNDRQAMQEICRVLKPGGWALVSVPILADEPTREDPSVTAPEERERLFGEKTHVRYYGMDIQDRLEAAGLRVTLEPAGDIDPDVVRKHGLRYDENIFFCEKPVVAALAEGQASAEQPAARRASL
jgi:SAM-dependent methyltransferase